VKHHKETLAAIATDEDMELAIDSWVAKRKYHKLLDLWVKGLAFDWNKLYGDNKPYRISLPTYPFAREHLWITRNKPELEDRATSADPIKSNTSHSPLGLSRLERPVVQHALQPTTQSRTISLKRVGKPNGISLQPVLSAPSQEVLQDELVLSLAKMLSVKRNDIDLDANFVDVGLDSIIGVEWIQTLNKHYGLSLPTTKIYDYPTIRLFSDFLSKECNTNKLELKSNKLHATTSDLTLQELVQRVQSGILSIEQADQLFSDYAQNVAES
jgi:polyketide synthase PksN